MRFLFWALALQFVFTVNSQAQCVNAYPYFEDFETTNGNWVSGGTSSDWNWAMPSKPLISQAASGSKCWMIGGVSSAFYNLGERSWLQSPCFDFSSVQHPYITFKIWWETEHTYDGANLQSSIDGGNTWQNVGSKNEPANCMTMNWYNTANINNLAGLAAVSEGWSGNVQSTQGSCQGGGGSNGWQTAGHCLDNLAGQSNVLLRFTFGAGTTCNSYDGLAIDAISIEEAPAITADYSFSCAGNNTVNFTANTDLCPDQLNWNFGDAGSASNTASGLTASHTFNTSGIYAVTFTAAGPCNPATTVTKNIEVIAINAAASDATCKGYADGYAYVTGLSSVNPLGFTWSTNPTQYTDTATGLVAGDYTVTVSSSSGCAATATVTVNEPAGVTTSFNVIPDTCSTGGTGSIQVSAVGGSLPYTYVWSNGAGSSAIQHVLAGSYNVTITDANTCSAGSSVFLPEVSGISIAFSELENVSCYGIRDGRLAVSVQGGTSPYTYTWLNAQSGPSLSHLDSGVYVVTVADVNGCNETDTAVIAKDYCPSYIYFPTAFTPNGDGANETFRPKYSQDLKQYHVRIYNRWGELVYESEDVNEGWNGFYKGVKQPLSVYVYYSEFTFYDGIKRSQAGNLTLLQ